MRSNDSSYSQDNVFMEKYGKLFLKYGNTPVTSSYLEHWVCFIAIPLQVLAH